MRWLKRSAGAVLGLIVLAAAAVAAYGWWSVPAERASYRLAAPIDEVVITIDSDGIPTIDAKSERDLAFGVGFMHGRDRLWQMEMNRRVGRGELAEVLGAQALEADRFLRTLGIHRAAAAQFARLPDEAKALLKAYADGVNAWTREAMPVRPPEFVLLGVKPGDWEPVDTVAWAIMMAYDLGGNWGTESLRLQLARRLPGARIDELLPPPPETRLPKHADYQAFYARLGVYAQGGATPSTSANATRNPLAVAGGGGLIDPIPGGVDGVGSNNWVVHGQHSSSGKPLLANDPHLSLAAPAIWYFTRQRAPGIEVSGATLPGAPSVILGRTRGVAWGFTNTGPDVQDLYLEEVNADGAARTPSGWQPLKVRRETIRVRGESDHELVVRESRHGPIISDVNRPLRETIDGKRFAIALRWTALDADNSSVLAAPAMNKAQTTSQLREALRLYVAPQQNVVMADTLGNAEFIAAGRVPLRRPDNDLQGLAPAPGWDERYDWVGDIAFDQLPQQSVTRFLATANQRIVGDDYPYFISAEWAHPGRKHRIEELLAAKGNHDAESMRQIQHDLKHTHDQTLLQWLPRVSSKHPLAPKALAALKRYQESPLAAATGDAATGTFLYWQWTAEVSRRLFAKPMGEPLYGALYGRRDFRTAMNGVLTRDDAAWCGTEASSGQRRCDAIVNAAFDAALDALQASQGTDPATWRWDRAHAARSEHRPFSQVAVLRDLFEVRTPSVGDTYSVMVGKVRGRPPSPFANEFSASLRAVYDLAEANASAASVIFSTGQSGNPFSTHYRDLAARWGSGGSSAYIDLARPTARGQLSLQGVAQGSTR